MKVTKYGHCCLLIEENGVRILTDPGSYSEIPEDLSRVDVILITHEHGDHLHIESLKKIIQVNPKVSIITNRSVGLLLDKEHISYSIVEQGQKNTSFGILIEGFGTIHAPIYKEFGRVENTGYFIADKLFYPGDAFTNPKKPVEVLAFPVIGPWCKMQDAIDYVLSVKPHTCFPVHDGILKQPSLVQWIPSKCLPEAGIKFIVLENGKETEF